MYNIIQDFLFLSNALLKVKHLTVVKSPLSVGIRLVFVM
jgi:hypothetical protein